MGGDHHDRTGIVIAEEMDRRLVHLGVGLVMLHDIGAEHRIPRQAAIFRHVGQKANRAVRQSRDDVFLLDAGQARHRIRPRLEPVPGQVEPDFVVFAECGDAEFFEQMIERHAVQDVEIGPRQFASAHPVHRGRISAAPCIGELLPIDAGDAAPCSQSLAVGGHRRPPIDHRPEHVMHQCLDLDHFLLPLRSAQDCTISGAAAAWRHPLRRPRTKNNAARAANPAHLPKPKKTIVQKAS